MRDPHSSGVGCRCPTRSSNLAVNQHLKSRTAGTQLEDGPDVSPGRPDRQRLGEYHVLPLDATVGVFSFFIRFLFFFSRSALYDWPCNNATHVLAIVSESSDDEVGDARPQSCFGRLQGGRSCYLQIRCLWLPPIRIAFPGTWDIAHPHDVLNYMPTFRVRYRNLFSFIVLFFFLSILRQVGCMATCLALSEAKSSHSGYALAEQSIKYAMRPSQEPVRNAHRTG